MKNRSYAIIGAGVGTAAIVSGLVIALVMFSPSGEEKRALIIDGMARDLPNQQFVDESIMIIEQMGYSVDVVDTVTLETYAKLPTMGYDLIILRTHGAEELTYLRSKTDGSLKLIGASSSLFTTEPYTEDKYLQEQEDNYVRPSTAVYNGKGYFAATSFFVKEKMRGEFDNTVIVMMGCYGFPDNKQELEESYTVSVPTALLEKGAGIVIGWDGLVSLDRTEEATINLLKNVQKGMSWQEAFDDTRRVGLGSDYTISSTDEVELKILTKDELEMH